MHKDNIDILGIAETSFVTQHRAFVPICIRSAHRTFSPSRVVLCAISYSSSFKPIGTALITAGSTTGRITNTYQDPMGRWCATSYRGAQTREVTVISAYRDLRRHGTIGRSMAAVTQQQAMINITDPQSTVHPRAKFRLDLHTFLQTLQQKGHEIILMEDFNEVFGSDPSGMIHIASSCTLVVILHRRIGASSFATFVGGRSRFDYVLMSQNAASALRHGGYEPPGFRFKGDHRGFCLDFDTNTLFGNVAPVMPPSASRNLVSNDR
jgi:hypothetical protein